MHGNVLKDRPWNSAIFKIELFGKIGNGKTCNQVVFACCCNELIIFKGKIEIG